MCDLHKLCHLLDGDLGSLEVGTLPLKAAELVLAEMAELFSGKAFPESFESQFDDYLSRGQILRAIALLKILSTSDPTGSILLPLLERALLWDADHGLENDTPEVLPQELLATHHPRLAWSVLRQDKMEIVAAPEPGQNLGSITWMIAHDPRPLGPQAPYGLALVWLSTTAVEGKPHRNAQRRTPRRKAVLQVKLTLLGQDAANRSMRGLRAELRDVSTSGLGLSVQNPLAAFSAREFEGRPVRIEFVPPGESQQVSALANIAWAHDKEDRGKPTTQLGLELYESPAEFVDAIRGLHSDVKDDQRCLWNLWISHSTSL